MEVISKEMERLLATGSTLRAMFEEGKRLAREYGKENVYDFSLGNPSVPAPAGLNDAFKQALDENESLVIHGYMSNAGYEDTREAIANELNERFGTDYGYQNITMTVGAANALCVALKILINPGDEVIVFAPFFLEYRNYISNFGGVTVVVPPNPPSFIPDMEEFKKRIGPRTKAIIINNPNNPTGVILQDEAMKQLTDIVREAEKKYGNSIFILSDDVYRELAYDGIKVPYIPNYYDNTLVAYSYSKAMSVPGERIGYLTIPNSCDEAERIIAASAIGVRVLGCVNAPSLQQKAIVKVLGQYTDISIYDKNRKALMALLKKAGFECVPPEGAFYLFMKTPIDDVEFVEKAKNDYQIVVSSGAAFDCPGYVRLAYCVDYDMIVRSEPAFMKLGHDFGLN